MDTDGLGVQIHRLDKHAGHGGDEILPLALDLVDLMGGVAEDAAHLADGLAALAVDGGETFDSNGKKTVWAPRDTVYIIDNTTNALGYSGLEDVFMGRVEDIVSPMIVYPMSGNNYFNVHDFIIFDNIQYDAIY